MSERVTAVWACVRWKEEVMLNQLWEGGGDRLNVCQTEQESDTSLCVRKKEGYT